MNVKTYTGKSITALLSQIKEECGADAIILSTKEKHTEKGTYQEILVGLEENTQRQSIATEEIEIVEQIPLQAQSTTESHTTVFEQKVHQELQSLKESLFSVLRPTMRLEKLTKKQRYILEYLLEEGVSEHIAMLLYKKMLHEEEASLTETLHTIVPIRPWGEREWKGRIHCLVGTSGSGKSSTLLRMALHLVKENSKLRVLILNMDTERSYGKFFLRYFAGLSNIAYQEVSSKEEIQEILRTTTADKVLIDMPSLPVNYTLARYLRMYTLENATMHIVLCAGMSKQHIEHTLERYKTDSPTSIIWTKLDEIASYGCVINTAVFFGIPISSLSYGTTVQNSLIPVNEKALWNIIFKHQLPL